MERANQPSATPKGFALWRMDDNGNRFLIGYFDSQAEALAEAHAFEAKGHKQTYWVEPE